MNSQIINKYPINCKSVILSSYEKDIDDVEYIDKFYFSNDWISGHYTYWSEQLNRYKYYKNVKILQLGVFEGRMTVYLHEEFLHQNVCEYTCIDSFGKTENVYFTQQKLNKRYDEKVALNRFRYNTRNYKDIKLIINEFNNVNLTDRFDIIILDTDDRTIIHDTIRCLELLQPAGTLYICYKLSAKTLGSVKRILPENFDLSMEGSVSNFNKIKIYNSTHL